METREKSRLQLSVYKVICSVPDNDQSDLVFRPPAFAPKLDISEDSKASVTTITNERVAAHSYRAWARSYTTVTRGRWVVGAEEEEEEAQDGYQLS
jgi:hypothetical protein